MPVVSQWDQVPDEDQQRIIKKMGECWDASAKHGGPLVMFHTKLLPEKVLPTEIVKRLDDCHSERTTLVFENKLITIWYDVVGITL